MTEVTCIVDCRADLGEGPLWDVGRQVLWWVDITRRQIHCTDAHGHDRVFPAPHDLGCLAVRSGGGLAVTMRNGFHFFDPDTGVFTPIRDPESDIPENRFNDGKPDRQGRFWAGTMHESARHPTGALYRLDTDLSCHRMVSSVHCSNGLAWSPDSRTMYYADSARATVWAWDFDPASGSIENRRVLIDTTELGGVPDGAAVDIEGCYWLTVPRTGKIVRYDPQGGAMRTITLPTDLPTCVTFGGPNLDILYCTTAVLGRGEAELAGQHAPGGLYAIDPGVRGIAEVTFAA